MSGKLYIKTSGCQMNEYDSQKMADVLAKSHQLTATANPEEADVILLNTCSIREKAEEKVFSDLGRYRIIKEKNPNLIIGVGGCVASQEGDAIVKRTPFVDLVFGPQTLHRLPEMLNETYQTKKSVVDISFPSIEKFDNLPEPRAEGPTAFVSIMEGCNKYCSFCIVPYTRGKEISRPFDDVIAEIAALAEQGVREVTLLGQNVNDYRGPMHDGQIADLALLIHYVSAIDGMGRIRFTTSHPLAFSEALIDAYANVPALANHLHLPVQSGSDRVLTLMKRNHTILEYKSKLRKLKKVRPNISISTDIIVGFPGETDEDFEKTLALVEEIQFDNSFSFIYSRRPGTPAADLLDNVPLEKKKARLQVLQERLRFHTDQISENMIGTEQIVLVDGHAKKDGTELSGRTENNRVVNFKGNSRLIGHFIPIKISEVRGYTLRGEVV